MDEMEERANAMGVSGDDGEDELPTPDDVKQDGPEGTETGNREATSPEESPLPKPPTTSDHTYPNPDRDKDVNMKELLASKTVYMPEDTKEDIESLKNACAYQFSTEKGGEMETHADFFTALFRVVAENPELVRAELGIDVEGP